MQTTAIKFNNEELIGVIDENNNVFVAVKPICEAIGFDSKRAALSIKNHPVLSGVYNLSYTHDTTNRVQKMLCLPLEYINGWLFSININRVNPKVKEKLGVYQKKCYQVLYDHFHGSTSRPELKRLSAMVRKKNKLLAEIKEMKFEVKQLIDGIEAKEMQMCNQLELFNAGKVVPLPAA